MILCNEVNIIATQRLGLVGRLHRGLHTGKERSKIILAYIPVIELID